jgi:serine/threonine protein kinase
VIIGGYNVIRELGRGGMGAVYEVDRGGRRFALKVMLEGSAERPDLVERFRREARVASLVASEHVVSVVEMGYADELRGAPFLVMELLDGSSVKDVVAERGRMAPERVCDVVVQAARALDRAHALGIVHRDLKPDNLYLHHAGRREIVKVLDFGVARLLDDDATAITATGATIGSLHYMPPEQCDSHSTTITPMADVWAIGMIAIELLTAERYWGTTKPTKLVTVLLSGRLTPPSKRWPELSLPPYLDGWFARSCAHAPSARFGTAGEQAAALAAIYGFRDRRGASR